MRAKSHRAWVRAVIVVLLALLALAPVTYSYFASMTSVKLRGTTTAGDFASVSSNAPSPETLLAYVDIASKQAAEGNYTEVKRLLARRSVIPANAEHNLVTYIALLHELVLVLDTLKPRLDKLQDLILAGATAQARENSTEIEDLIGEASGRLDLLFSSLNRIRTIYHVDTENQRRDLQTISSTLQSFAHHLADLKDQLDAMERGMATQLDLQAYPIPVQVEGTLDTWGELRSSGNALAGRVVELWVNGIQRANLTLDQLGRFAWTHVVSNDSRNDKLELYAYFSPAGEDVSEFRPSKSATVVVPVNYYPVRLTISATSERVVASENLTVQGQLADVSGNLLVGETVDLLVDGKPVKSSVTDAAGKYSIVTAFPPGTREGEHQVRAQFDPKQGIFAAAESESIAIQLYYLRSTLSGLALSGGVLAQGEFLAISGQTIQLEGRLDVDSKAYDQGLVIAFLGDRELGRALSGTGGIFHISFSVPLDLSDMQTIHVLFVPARPWVARTTAQVVVRVLSSAAVALVIGAALSALVVFSGRSINTGAILRRPAASRRRPEGRRVAPQKPEVRETSATAPALLSLADFKLELQLGVKSEEPRLFVKSVYWEIRRMLAEVLDARGEPSETPREFGARVAGKLSAAASSLSALTQLFEVAEYSQHVVFRSEAQEGIGHAFRIAEEINARTKT